MQKGFTALILLFALAGHASAETASNYEIIARLSQAPETSLSPEAAESS